MFREWLWSVVGTPALLFHGMAFATATGIQAQPVTCPQQSRVWRGARRSAPVSLKVAH
jgi:hypothetical protein